MIQGAKVVFGLGSNIGECSHMLAQAVTALGDILENITCSSLYESDALLFPDSPPEWNISFLNMAVSGFTHASPHTLLGSIKAIEKQLGRQDRGRWAPREIDIDILAYGDSCITSESLQIPHAALLERPFALYPFAEICPDWKYPVNGHYYGKTAKELLEFLPEDAGESRKLPSSILEGEEKVNTL